MCSWAGIPCSFHYILIKKKRDGIMAKVQKALWAEEKAEVEVLLAQRNEHANIGKRLKTLQASVEGGGRTVRDGLGQVHSNTNQHQVKIHSMFSGRQLKMESNLLLFFKTSRSSPSTLTRCLSQDKTKERKRESFGLGKSNLGSSRCSSMLTKYRPAQVGLIEYMNSLKRVNRALAEMGTTNMRANQQAIGDFNELLAEGCNKLELVYRSLLLEYSQPLEPLHYLTRGK